MASRLCVTLVAACLPRRARLSAFRGGRGTECLSASQSVSAFLDLWLVNMLDRTFPVAERDVIVPDCDARAVSVAGDAVLACAPLS